MSTKKLIKRPDHDPDNPYHYHTEDGKKVVITPEDWEANVGKPYFREVEAAVRAEQVAHPAPEYEVNPAFVRDLRSTYQYNMGNGYQNYKYFSSVLPQGYSFTDEGLIVDSQGNYYVQSGYRQSPRFTYNINSPLQFTINKGKPIEKTLIFYPINMDKELKSSLPVDVVRNIPTEKSMLKNKKLFRYNSDYNEEMWWIFRNHPKLNSEDYVYLTDNEYNDAIKYIRDFLTKQYKNNPDSYGVDLNNRIAYDIKEFNKLGKWINPNDKYIEQHTTLPLLNFEGMYKDFYNSLQNRNDQGDVKYFLIKHNLESGKSDSTEYKTLREMSNAFNAIQLQNKQQ